MSSTFCSTPTIRNRDSLEDIVFNYLLAGRVLAAISSRPGQCGRSDGYILEVLCIFSILNLHLTGFFLLFRPKNDSSVIL